MRIRPVTFAGRGVEDGRFLPVHLLGIEMGPSSAGPGQPSFFAKEHSMGDVFLKVDGAKGESQDADHKDEIDVLSFSFGISQAASAISGSAGGGTVAKANFQDLVISKEKDLASAKLQEFCATGKHIDSIVLLARRAAGDSKVDYMKYTLTDSIISSFSVGGSTDGIPIETVAFNYAKVEYEYKQQARAGGGEAGTATYSYDLAANKKS